MVVFKNDGSYHTRLYAHCSGSGASSMNPAPPPRCSHFLAAIEVFATAIRLETIIPDQLLLLQTSQELHQFITCLCDQRSPQAHLSPITICCKRKEFSLILQALALQSLTVWVCTREYGYYYHIEWSIMSPFIPLILIALFHLPHTQSESRLYIY